MLLQFKFKNYKSFKEEAVLDMVASNIKDHKESLIEINEIKVLPLAAIFGANASGKSNLFSAFITMCLEVVKKFDKNDSHDFIIPYIFDEAHSKKPTEFEVSIFNNETNLEYRYGFLRDQKQVYEEWLFEKKVGKNTTEKCVFYRQTGNEIIIEVSSKIDKEELLYVNSMIDTTSLLITDIGKRNKSIYSRVYDWFVRTVSFHNYSNDYQETFTTRHDSRYLYENTDGLDEIKGLLKNFDNSILDLEIRKDTDNDLNEQYKVYSLHNCISGEKKWIPFESESSGTKKIFSFSTQLLLSIKYGLVMFIDELDAKLHPLVLRFIIKLFRNSSSNIGKGQLVFSSHNLVCLDSSDLRRDEIWFVEKNDQASTMYSLYDFKEDELSIRADLSFGKNYLSGRFGAIPFQNTED